MDRLGQDKRRFLLDIGERPVGGEPDGKVLAVEGDVIAAERTLLNRPSIIGGWTHPDGDAGKAGERLDNADQLRRPEHAAELAEARREIGDPDRAVFLVGQDGGYDRRIALVVRREVGEVLQHDIGESLFLIARHKAREHRIAVEAREAPPDQARGGVEQRRRLPVADHGKIEPEILHGPLPLRVHICLSQDRTS